MSSDGSPEEIASEQDERPGFLGPLIAFLSIALTVACWTLEWRLAFNIGAVVVISVVIWQACDPFADAAQWIGNRWHLPGSVRGATLDAVASSLPELFTGVFFVLTPVLAHAAEPADLEASSNGYGETVATCAGSAVYNMILIPAFVALVISFARKNRPTVDVEDKVIARDGIAFLLCQMLLLLLLFLNELHWWMGILFLLAYVVYVRLLYTDWKDFEVIKKHFLRVGIAAKAKDVRKELADNGLHHSLSQVEQVKAELERRGHNSDEEEEEDDHSAGVLFGFLQVRLNNFTAWATIFVATLIAAAACYFLVEVTKELADILQVPTFFMAVIVAAAASSVPDTLLSIAAAMRGDDSGAVSNAFGSNIFDICVCLSVPLFLASALNGWQPVSLLHDGKPMEGLVGLRTLLGVLTVVTLAIMWHNRQLTRKKALVLCGLYGIFIAYAVLGSLKIIAV